MRKKIIILGTMIIMMVVELMTFTGCGSKKEIKEEKKEENTVQTPQVVDESLVKINNQEFHLSKEATFKEIKYSIIPDFKEADHNHYIQYSYSQEDRSNLLYFRIFYYEGKENDAAIKDLGLEGDITLTNGKNDYLEYKLYEKPRDDGGTIHFYFINNNGNTYALNFVSKYDIKEFENKVVKSLKF
jgi:hypothetical protein